MNSKLYPKQNVYIKHQSHPMVTYKLLNVCYVSIDEGDYLSQHISSVVTCIYSESSINNPIWRYSKQSILIIFKNIYQQSRARTRPSVYPGWACIQAQLSEIRAELVYRPSCQRYEPSLLWDRIILIHLQIPWTAWGYLQIPWNFRVSTDTLILQIPGNI